VPVYATTYTIQITASFSAVFIADAHPEASFFIVNGDQQNTIYIGDDASIGVGNPSESIPLLPGASLGITTDRPVPTYINGSEGVVSPVYIIPGASGYFRPISDLILQGLNPGIFIYRPTAAYNNLAGAWTALAGVDQYGNAYGAGITLNQGNISGLSVTNGTIFGTYVQGSNLANSFLGGPSISGGSSLGADIVQTQQGGVLLGYGAGLVTVTLSASQEWPVPSGVTAAKVECTAGSGAGGANGTNGGAGAGGGPEYSCEPNYPLTPGASVAALVGAGGYPATGTGTGGSGGITSFDGTVIAHPGLGGGPSNGGLGGSGSINTVHYSGGQGGNGSSSGGGGGGGGAATATGAGGAGSSATSSAGANPGTPGGGAGGSSGDAGNTGTQGGGGGAGSGTAGTNYTFVAEATYSYYGSDATSNTPNSLRSTIELYSGEDQLGTVNGNQYSFALFQGIQAALTGHTIISCQLVVTLDYVYNGALTGTLVIGYSDAGSFPASGMSLASSTPNVAQCSVTGGQTIWSVDLSQTSIPSAFQSGLATSILFGPGPTTSAIYFCETPGITTGRTPPQLIFQVV
jgi:hypothetical protein